MKQLSTKHQKELRFQNEARRLVFLPEILIKVRTCYICGIKFESIGSRTCGCGQVQADYGRHNIQLGVSL